MQDKIALLMEETGCDRGEAELALEMCGYEVEKAVQALPRLLKNIVVVKGKLVQQELFQYGLMLVVLNLKTQNVLRARAVLSYNPAVYGVPLEQGWFEFEKHLYACRLWEGSLQNESQEIEQRLLNHFRSGAGSAAFAGDDRAAEISGEIRGVLPAALSGAELSVKKEILDLGQFQSLRSDSEAAHPGRAEGPRPSRAAAGSPRSGEPLVLKITLDEDPEGAGASELRAGDIISARIADQRDIAQYLAKLFGGYSDKGPQPIMARIEAIEAAPPSGLLVRVRFSVGVCADAFVPGSARIKVDRMSNRREREPSSWWRRFFNA